MAEYIDLNETIIDFGFEWDDIAPTRDEFINFLKSRKRANVKKLCMLIGKRLMEWDITDAVIVKRLTINTINQNIVRIVVLK